MKACKPLMRRLVLCTTCNYSTESKLGPDGRTGGEILIAALQVVLQRQGRDDVVIQRQACLWNCTKPCSVAILDDVRFSYITGGNTPDEEQAEAILQWFDAHGVTSDGQVPFKQWPQKMRGHLIARIPPIPA